MTACGSKLKGMTDADLQDKVYQCNSIIKPSPGKAVSCGNFLRECQRRREEGRFVC